MSNKPNSTVATMGIDIGKNSFHVVGLDQRGAIVLRQKWSRGQVEGQLASMPPCMIGIRSGSTRRGQLVSEGPPALSSEKYGRYANAARLTVLDLHHDASPNSAAP